MMRLAIFRPERLIDRSVEYCESRGIDVTAAPSIDLYPREEEMQRFLSAVEREDPDVVVLTSQNSIRLLDEVVGERGVDLLRGQNIAAIGSKTMESLEEREIDVDVVPETYSSAGLVDALEPYAGGLVFVARSDQGDETLFEAERFLDIREFQIYRVGLPRDTDPLRGVQDRGLEGSIEAFAFTSTMTVRNFLEVAREDGRREEVKTSLEEAVVAALGRPTEETLEDLGIGVDAVPEVYTFEGLVDAAIEAVGEG